MGSLEQAVYAIIISFVIGVILCPIVIPMLRKLKFGQNVTMGRRRIWQSRARLRWAALPFWRHS